MVKGVGVGIFWIFEPNASGERGFSPREIGGKQRRNSQVISTWERNERFRSTDTRPCQLRFVPNTDGIASSLCDTWPYIELLTDSAIDFMLEECVNMIYCWGKK
jgi:hypothetical protein